MKGPVEGHSAAITADIRHVVIGKSRQVVTNDVNSASLNSVADSRTTAIHLDQPEKLTGRSKRLEQKVLNLEAQLPTAAQEIAG